jgi:hypothetical protein
MVEFWEPVLRPLLEAAAPRVVVEVGSLNGATTSHLLEFAADRDCVVHAIDPTPSAGFDLTALRERFADHFVFHPRMSLETLHDIDRIDAVLVDGDHNWYTVFHELKLLEQGSREAEHPFPLTFIHDIGWPYGRRDGYWNPSAIPDAHRQPYRRAGVLPGRSELAVEGGVNPHGHNAVVENTPQNGVRTAVEDFLSESKSNLRFETVVGFSGLGILVSETRSAVNGDLVRALDHLGSAEWLRAHCERLEQARIRAHVRIAGLKARLDRGSS